MRFLGVFAMSAFLMTLMNVWYPLQGCKWECCDSICLLGCQRTCFVVCSLPGAVKDLRVIYIVWVLGVGDTVNLLVFWSLECASLGVDSLPGGHAVGNRTTSQSFLDQSQPGPRICKMPLHSGKFAEDVPSTHLLRPQNVQSMRHQSNYSRNCWQATGSQSQTY